MDLILRTQTVQDFFIDRKVTKVKRRRMSKQIVKK
jgi:hypothetical protein